MAVDWQPATAALGLLTTPWGWLTQLSGAHKAALAAIGLVGLGLTAGLAGSRFILDRERFASGAAAALVNAERIESDSVRLDEHIRLQGQIVGEGLRRLESVESSLDVLRVLRDRQRTDSARLDRIECFVEAIAAQSGPAVLARCGVRGRTP